MNFKLANGLFGGRNFQRYLISLRQIFPKPGAKLENLPKQKGFLMRLISFCRHFNRLKDILLPTKPKGFIIGGDNPLTLSAFRAMWKRIVNTIDMHGATPHTLRHSYLTYAVGKTTDYKTIQGISGHSDVFTLMNRYAHPQAEKMKQLSEKIGKILL